MKFSRYLWFLGVFLIIMSCVKDDLSDCPPVNPVDPGLPGETSDWYLHFRTIPAKYTFRNVVESLDLYIYDRDEHDLVEVIDYSYEDLAGNDFSIHLGGMDCIIKDSYRFVVVMNATEHYEVVPGQTIQEYELSIVQDAEKGDFIDFKLNDVFSGYLDAVAQTKTIRRDTVDLVKLINHVTVTVEFENYSLPPGYELSASITGSNGHYNYEFDSKQKALKPYMPYMERFLELDYIFEYDITTAKLTIDDDMMLNVEERNQQDDFFRDLHLSLTGELAKIKDDNGNYLYNTNEKLMQEDEFFFYFLLDKDFKILELTINDWILVRQEEDL